MEELLKIASHELGISEISGSIDNERIVQYAQETGQTWINDDETPWCSIFLNWVAKQAHFEQSGSATARSWLEVGFSVDQPEPGDIVVYWRDHPESAKGHVGLFLGYSSDQSRIYTLGGNQADSVSISAYPAERLLDFRRLMKVEDVALPDPVLQRGDQGAAVARLQDALKLGGYKAGTSDGIFGPITEEALKKYQSAHLELEATGVYDDSTRDALAELLNTE